MTKRVHLSRQSGFGEPETDVEMSDEDAKRAVDAGVGEYAANQVVYGHESDMSDDVKAEAYRMKSVADAAGDYRQVAARSAATAAAKKGASK